MAREFRTEISKGTVGFLGPEIGKVRNQEQIRNIQSLRKSSQRRTQANGISLQLWMVVARVNAPG